MKGRSVAKCRPGNVAFGAHAEQTMTTGSRSSPTIAAAFSRTNNAMYTEVSDLDELYVAKLGTREIGGR